MAQASQPSATVVRLGLPKGRLQEGVFRLLGDCGIQIRLDSRGYRPELSLPGFDSKILKPQNVIEMLHAGSRDIGFGGLDWARELKADLVDLLDTGLDPVRIVAAAPEELLTADGALPKGRPIVVASEYETLTRQWLAERRLAQGATFVRSYGATEVFPPEDADVIVDNAATGSTLRANHLVIIDDILRSSTRLFANPRALENPAKRAAIEDFTLLLSSALEARKRVIVEINVGAECLDSVLDALPCMREPTVSPLRNQRAFAVKVAVLRSDLPTLVPLIKARGGTDILVTAPSQIVP